MKTYTKKDLEKAYNAGADKRTWTKVKLKDTANNAYTIQPVFKTWLKKSKL